MIQNKRASHISKAPYVAILIPIVAFCLSGVTIFFMSFYTRDKYLLMVTGLALLFWLFVIIGIGFTVLLIRSKKNRALKRNKINRTKENYRRAREN